ncbi:MAG TPA: hypothetical protein VGD83_05345 [Streptosporangiaceae bacterium]
MSADIASIDAALAKAMSDNDLQSVIQQYYDAPISSRMLPSVVLPGSVYAVAVYSEPGNGIPAFDQPWKSVAATIYHQLNEARIDPGVDDAIRTGDSTRLGWYSASGGEIGDIPVREAGTSHALVFREVDLADGSGAVPVQLMWSNKTSTPATRLA